MVLYNENPLEFVFQQLSFLHISTLLTTSNNLCGYTFSKNTIITKGIKCQNYCNYLLQLRI